MIQKNPTTLNRDFLVETASSGDFFNYAAQATDEDCLWVLAKRWWENGNGDETTRQVVRGGIGLDLGDSTFVLIDIHDTNELN